MLAQLHRSGLEQTRTIVRWLAGLEPCPVLNGVVEAARDGLKRMEGDEHLMNLLQLRGTAAKQALADHQNLALLAEYKQHKANLHATTPIIWALTLDDVGALVYFYTDLELTLMMTEDNLVKWIASREVMKPAIICPMNPILNKIFEKAGTNKLNFTKLRKPYSDVLKELQSRLKLSEAERKVVELIRERDYQRVIAHVKGGHVIQTDVEEDLPATLPQLAKSGRLTAETVLDTPTNRRTSKTRRLSSPRMTERRLRNERLSKSSTVGLTVTQRNGWRSPTSGGKNTNGVAVEETRP